MKGVLDLRWFDKINKFNTLEMISREANRDRWGKERIVEDQAFQFLKPTPELRRLLMLFEISKNPKTTQTLLARLTNLSPFEINKGCISMEG